MKNSTILFTLLISSFFILSCHAQNSDLSKTKHSLVEKFINSPEVESSKVNGKIIIVKTKYCREFDCETYFEAYKDKILVWDMDEAFSRSIKNFIVIETIDENKGQLIFSRNIDRQHEKVEIKL